MKICCVVLNHFGHEDTITCVQALVNQNDLEKIIIVENSANSTELSILKNIFKNDGQVEILEPINTAKHDKIPGKGPKRQRF